MHTLNENAILFAASCTFQDAAEGLGKILHGEELTAAERRSLGWAGTLVGQMDWNCLHYGRRPDVAALATELRPRFYQYLLKQRVQFDEDLSGRAYNMLKSPDTVDLHPEEVGQFQEVFRSLASDIMAGFQKGNI